MAYIFNSVGYEENGVTHRMSDTHAIFVLEETALDAAHKVTQAATGEDVKPLLYTPYPLVALEWLSKHPMRFINQYGETKVGNPRICVAAEMKDAEKHFSNCDFEHIGDKLLVIYPIVQIGDELIGHSSGYILAKTNEAGALMWHDNKPGPNEIELPVEYWEQIIETVIGALVFINSPNLHEREFCDMTKLNRKRVGAGKRPLSNYTVIRPNAQTREWNRAVNASKTSDRNSHWVKSHIHKYWTGPRDKEQKPVFHLLAPFTRGNKGEAKAPRYKVRA